ncbi:MAG: YggT family protein [Coriobacteriia bacterium]|nr:YggT family protein [Coriobacteriia bacterium]
MEKDTEETVTTHDSNVYRGGKTPSRREASGPQTVEYIVYFLFGILEILLAFRFVLKLTGASASSGFVDFIYRSSGTFTLPFEGIFRAFSGRGVETTASFEPSTLVALVVYAIIAWGIVKLIQILSGEQQS